MRRSPFTTRLRVAMLVAAVSATIGQAWANGNPLQTGFWAPTDPPRVQYTIDCRIDPEKATLQGTETIRLTNTAKKPMSRLIIYQQVRKGSTLRVSVNGRSAIVLQEVDYPSALGNYCNSPFEAFISALESLMGSDAFDRVYRRCMKTYGGTPSKSAVMKQLSGWLRTTWTKEQVSQLLADATKLNIQAPDCWLRLALGAYQCGSYQEALAAIEHGERVDALLHSLPVDSMLFGISETRWP